MPSIPTAAEPDRRVVGHAPAATRVEPRSIEALRRSRWERRAMIAVLILFVLAGVIGIFGSRTSSVTAAAGGYRFTVTYAQVSRPGLPIRWVYQVRRPGGFSGPIRITTTFDYLHVLDTTNILPAPTARSSTSDEIIWDSRGPSATPCWCRSLRRSRWGSTHLRTSRRR